VIGEINLVLGQDMPLVLLGYTYTPLQMKANVAEQVFNDDEQDIEERTWRYQVFTTYSIVHNVRVDMKNSLQWGNFVNFITKNIAREEKAGSSVHSEEEREDIAVEDGAIQENAIDEREEEN
jgi:hypothetical protein